MAAVTRVKARQITPPGYEYVSPPGATTRATAAEALTAGDLCYLGSTGWLKATATNASAGKKLAFAAQDYAAGRKDCSMFFQGEMDGFSGMTPGDPIYPSTTAGALDTTAPTYYTAATTPTVSVPATPKIWALSATSIYFDL